MRFLICPVTDNQMELFGTEDHFTSESGEGFAYMVEYMQGDMVRIWDNCGRVMPFDIDEIEEVIEALERISAYETCTECLLENLKSSMETAS